jgi:hypothetical protein
MSRMPFAHPAANVAVIASGGLLMGAAGYLSRGAGTAVAMGAGGAWMCLVVFLGRRAGTAVPPGVHEAYAVGRAGRLSLRVLRLVTAYERAAFGPHRGDGGARAAAYLLAAHDDLPEPVRRAAAAALAAIDHHDGPAGDRAVAVLSTRVREQAPGPAR